MLQLTSSVFSARFSDNIHLLACLSFPERPVPHPSVPLSHPIGSSGLHCGGQPGILLKSVSLTLQLRTPCSRKLHRSAAGYVCRVTFICSAPRMLMLIHGRPAQQRSTSFRRRQSRLNGSRYRMGFSGVSGEWGRWNESSKASHWSSRVLKSLECKHQIYIDVRCELYFQTCLGSLFFSAASGQALTSIMDALRQSE